MYNGCVHPAILSFNKMLPCLSQTRMNEDCYLQCYVLFRLVENARPSMKIKGELNDQKYTLHNTHYIALCIITKECEADLSVNSQ